MLHLNLLFMGGLVFLITKSFTDWSNFVCVLLGIFTPALMRIPLNIPVLRSALLFIFGICDGILAGLLVLSGINSFIFKDSSTDVYEIAVIKYAVILVCIIIFIVINKKSAASDMFYDGTLFGFDKKGRERAKMKRECKKATREKTKEEKRREKELNRKNKTSERVNDLIPVKNVSAEPVVVSEAPQYKSKTQTNWDKL